MTLKKPPHTPPRRAGPAREIVFFQERREILSKMRRKGHIDEENVPKDVALLRNLILPWSLAKMNSSENEYEEQSLQDQSRDIAVLCP